MEFRKIYTVQRMNVMSQLIWVRDECLPWDLTLEYFELLGIEPVPVIYDGVFPRGLSNWKKCDCAEVFGNDKFDGINKEGYVVRLADRFTLREFPKSVAKYVGKDFVLPHGHWTKEWTKNKLK